MINQKKSKMDKNDDDNITLVDKYEWNKAPIRIGLLSNSEIKIQALKDVIKEYETNVIINIYKINDKKNQIEQPIDDGGINAARNRLKHAMAKKEIMNENDIIIVMENYMLSSTGEDYVYVILYDCMRYEMITKNKFCVKAQDMELFKYLIEKYKDHKWGCTNKTYGELLHERNNDIPAKDWMSQVIKKSRVDVLKEAMREVYEDYLRL